MTYELIDIVDEYDNVIRQVERTPEWNKSRPDVHRFVHVHVWTSDHKLLVQQRSSNKGSKPLRFDAAVGGLVPAGMSYEEAAHKEMEEELGIKGVLSLVSPFKDIALDTGKLSAHAHLFEIMHDGPYTNWEEEAERLERFSIDELKTMTTRFPYLFTSGFIHSFNLLCDVKKL